MDVEMDISIIQEALLAALPMWNYRIAKPFKQLLDEGVSLEMYYCIQTLRWAGGIATMSELARWSRMPKQQMTKMVNRLVEYGFVERMYDPTNRRIIKIQITDKASDYIVHFLQDNAQCFRQLLEQMDSKDRQAFKEAIDTINCILHKLPCNPE